MYDQLGEMEQELEGLGELESEFETEFESEFESEFENEFESESEFEFALEGEGLNPISRVYPDAMMEHLGRAAVEAETEFEAAEHFLPLIPLVASKLLPLAAKALPKIAGKVLPRVAKSIAGATPKMTRAVTHLTRALHRNPRTRPLVRVIPSVARRAVSTIARRTATGRPVSPNQAVQILAREKRRVLGNPRIVRSVLQRSKKMDRKFHPLGHPAHGYRYGYGKASRAGVPARLAQLGAPVASYGRAPFCPTCGAAQLQALPRACCC